MTITVVIILSTLPVLPGQVFTTIHITMGDYVMATMTPRADGVENLLIAMIDTILVARVIDENLMDTIVTMIITKGAGAVETSVDKIGLEVEAMNRVGGHAKDIGTNILIDTISVRGQDQNRGEKNRLIPNCKKRVVAWSKMKLRKILVQRLKKRKVGGVVRIRIHQKIERIEMAEVVDDDIGALARIGAKIEVEVATNIHGGNVEEMLTTIGKEDTRAGSVVTKKIEVERNGVIHIAVEVQVVVKIVDIVEEMMEGQ